MKKIIILLLLVGAAAVTGCYFDKSGAGSKDNAFCERLSNPECSDYQDRCELCEGPAASFATCHSIEFCADITPVKEINPDQPKTDSEEDAGADLTNGQESDNDTDQSETETEVEIGDAAKQATTTENETDPDTEAEEENGDETPAGSTESLTLDEFILAMKKNVTVSGYLKNECLENEFNCPSGMYYQWEKINSTNYKVAFISFKADQAKKDDAFDYSGEIYRINLETGDVQRRSADGSFVFIANIY